MTPTNKRHRKQFLSGFKVHALLLMLLPLLGGCGMRSGVAFFATPDEPEVAGRSAQYATLDLHIAVNAGGDPSTRAFPDSEDGSFEGPATKFENVNTLRVVIVDLYTDENGTQRDSIEHNRLVNVKGAYADSESNEINGYYIINDNLQFKVSTNGYGREGRKKKIYLFANEKAVNMNKVESEQFDFTAELLPGKPFPTEKVEGILIVRPEGKPFIDNNPGSTDGTFVPMSEYFDVTIPAATGAPEDSYTETLFLTRSLIKFSFSVTLVPGEDVDVNYMKDLSGMKLRGVRISNLANTCYYLPKETIYDPPKGQSSTEDMSGRKITAFETPGLTGTPDYLGSECTFLFKEPLDLTLDGRETDSYIYLPETKTDETYNLSLLFSNPDEDEFYNDLYGSKPLQLNNVMTKDIPRNSHVKVNIYLTAHSMSATVTLFPYTAVNLKPTFGF